MDTVRTTVSLPKAVHQAIRKEAFDEGKSFNSIVIEKLSNKSKKAKFRITPLHLGVKGELSRSDIYEEILGKKF